MIPVHVAVAAARRPRGDGPRKSRPERRAIAVKTVVVATLFGGLAPVFGVLLEDVHGGAAAAGILIGLLSAGLGFGLAKLVGRQLEP